MRSKWGQIILAVAAVALLGVAGVRFYGQWRESQPVRLTVQPGGGVPGGAPVAGGMAMHRPPQAPPVPVDPAVTLTDWRVAAVPVLAGRRPRLAAMAPEAADNLDRRGTRPAICLQLTWLTEKAGGQGRRFPLAALCDAIRIRRAPAGTAAWSPAAEYGAASFGTIMLVPAGPWPAASKRVEDACWVDAAVEPGRLYDYQVQLLRGGKVWAESGVCTGVAVALPELRTATTVAGRREFRWGEPTPAAAAGLVHPRLWLTLNKNTTRPNLACLPWAAGSWVSPLSAEYLDRQEARLCLTARLRHATWSKRDGRTEDYRPILLTGAVPPRKAPRMGRPAAPPPVVDPLPEWGGLCWRLPFDDGMDGNSMLRFGDAADSVKLDDVCFWFDNPIRGRWREWRITFPAQPVLDTSFLRPEEPIPLPWPGPAERVHFQLGPGPGPLATPGAPCTFSMLRVPVPEPLRAVCGDGWVKVTWSALRGIRADDWLDGPRFVLARIDQADMAARSAGGDNPRTWGRSRELYVGGPEVLEYTDREVRNGFAYAYVLRVEGVARATGWRRQGGAFDLPQPVRAAAPFGWSGRPLLAVPEPPHPLRVGLLLGGEPQDADSSDAVVRDAFSNALAGLPGMTVVERIGADKLFVERQLVRTAGAEEAAAAAATGPANPTPADLFLEWRQRRDPDAAWYDIWLADHRQGIHERLWTGRAVDFVPAAAAREVARQLAARYPGMMAAAPASALPPAAMSRRLRIAVGNLADDDGSQEEAGKLDDLLALALTERREFEVVDRRETARMVSELGAAAADPLQLGRLLKADRIVTGSCTEAAGRIHANLRLLDPVSGAVVATLTEAAPAAELDAFCTRLAARLAAVGGPAAATAPALAASPVLRDLEAAVFRQAARWKGRREEEAGGKRAAFLAPEDFAHCLSLAQAKVGDDAIDEAMGYYRQAIEVVPKGRLAGVSGGFARLLLDAGYNAEAETVLGEAIARTADSPEMKNELTVLRGRALHLLGRDLEALALVRETAAAAPISEQAYKQALLLEQLNAMDEAAACWVSMCESPPWSFFVQGPFYPNLAQRLERPEYAAHQTELLTALAGQCLQQQRGWLALKCLETIGDKPVSAAPKLRDMKRQALGLVGLGVPAAEREAEFATALARATPAMAAAYRKVDAAIAKKDAATAERIIKETLQESNNCSPDDRCVLVRMHQNLIALRKPNQTPAARQVPAPAKTAGPPPAQPPLCVNGRRFQVTLDATLVASDDASGRELWKTKLPPLDPTGKFARCGFTVLYSWPVEAKNITVFNAFLVAYRDLILVPDLFGGAVLAYDAATGQPRWHHLEWFPVSNLQVGPAGIGFGTMSGDLVTLDDTGRVVNRRVSPVSVWPSSHPLEPLMISQATFKGQPGTAFHPIRQAQCPPPRQKPQDPPARLQFQSTWPPQFFWPQDRNASLYINPETSLRSSPPAKPVRPVRRAPPRVAAQRPPAEPPLPELKKIQAGLREEYPDQTLRQLLHSPQVADINQLRPELARIVARPAAADQSESRLMAVKLLAGWWGAEAVAGEIAPALDDPSLTVKAEVIQQLGQSHQAGYAPRLVTLMAEVEAKYRKQNGTKRPALPSLDTNGVNRGDLTVDWHVKNVRCACIRAVITLAGPAQARQLLAPVLNAPDDTPEKQFALDWLAFFETPATSTVDAGNAAAYVGDLAAVPPAIKKLVDLRTSHEHSDRWQRGNGDGWCYARSGFHVQLWAGRTLQDLTGRDFGLDVPAWQAWAAAQSAAKKP